MATADPAPATTTTTSTTDVHTYHCHCSQLLLATSVPLSTLPQRAHASPTTPDSTGTLDQAHILALSSTSFNTDYMPSAGETPPAPQPYATHVHIMPAPASPTVIQRGDGLEKRYLARCGRCRTVIAYWLDWAQWGYEEAGGFGGVGKKTAAFGRRGRRDDVLYVLPGAVVETGEMVAAGQKGGK